MKKTAIVFALILMSSKFFAAEEISENTDQELLVENLLPPHEEIAAAEKAAAAPVEVTRAHGPEEEDEADPRILRDFIESRGLIACRQKCGSLIIAGDVRARWNETAETVNGLRARGSGTGFPMARYRTEFNLFLDYTDPKSWVSTKTKWSAAMGVDGGNFTKTELDRAFIGYDIFECGEEDFYIELGRSRLEYIFDSRVEFSSFFDGIHLFYTNEFAGLGQFVIHGGPFIIDSYTNHYGWAVETFFDDFACTGFTFKYSLINWAKHGTTKIFGDAADLPKATKDNPRYRFLISQLLIGYTGKIDFCHCKTFYLYGAVLANHDAKKNYSTNFAYANKAFYLGFTLGKLCKACDWSFDINYQFVQAQAVPEFDLAGIGHGNVSGALLSDAIILLLPPDEAMGFTNFKGFQISLLYAVTDTLSLRSKAEWSSPITKVIGGNFFYKNFEIAAIYAF